MSQRNVREAVELHVKPANSRQNRSRGIRCVASTGSILEKLESRLVMSAPPLPVIPAGTFNVMNFGAVGDGTTEDTVAIQAAITAAGTAGGGTVVLPAGKTFLSNFLTVSNNNINVEIDGTLLCEPFANYTTPSKSLITFNKVNNVELSGTGTIEGQGGVGVNGGWWGNAAIGVKPVSTRPRLVRFSNDDIVEIKDITLHNSPSINIIFSGETDNVTATNVKIFAPASETTKNPVGELASHNTDGIDPSGQHYLIENCDINTGDDDIAVTAAGTHCADITVRDCTFENGHGISVGGTTMFGLTGMLVYNCTFNGTDNGLRLKGARGNAGVVTNITYSHITMTNVDEPIVIDSYYNGGNNFPTTLTDDPGQPLNSTTPIWKNIVYADITATGAQDDALIYGVPEAPVQNVTFMNVNITAINGLTLDHAHNVVFTGSTSFSPAPITSNDATIFKRTSSSTSPVLTS